MLSSEELAYYSSVLVSYGFEISHIDTQVVYVRNTNLSTLNHHILLSNCMEGDNIRIELNTYDTNFIYFTKVNDDSDEVILLKVPVYSNEECILFITQFDKFTEMAYNFMHNSDEEFDSDEFNVWCYKLAKELNKNEQ